MGRGPTAVVVGLVLLWGGRGAIGSCTGQPRALQLWPVVPQMLRREALRTLPGCFEARLARAPGVLRTHGQAGLGGEKLLM